MPAAVPRIARVLPHGPVTRPNHGIPVVARLDWANGETTEVEALAVAWTHDSVEIRWTFLGEDRNDWIAATAVRSRPRGDAGDPDRPDDAADPA